MKQTKKVDSIGRIMLPKAYRNKIGARAGTEMETIMHGDSLIVRKKPTKEYIVANCITCLYYDVDAPKCAYCASHNFSEKEEI